MDHKSTSKNNFKIAFVSLGCSKNLVDSEDLITLLRHEGIQIIPTYEQADLVIINTCGFINSAIDESLDTIGEALKINGNVIITGCLGTKKEFILSHYPNVLAVTGPQDFDGVLNAVKKTLRSNTSVILDSDPGSSPSNLDSDLHQNKQEEQPEPMSSCLNSLPKTKLTPSHYAYLKIAEGCNHRCTYCIIPDLRGKLVSRPIGDILDEAENLVRRGFKELSIIAQDTGAYGQDLQYSTAFWRGIPLQANLYHLANQLSKLGIWIRLHYLYPYKNLDQIVELMADEKVLPYLDVPLQHVNHRLLKLMKRPGNIENTLKQIENWRNICPNLTIRSTFIVGFPGETEEEFEELLDFLKTAKLDRVGCFPYSDVDGAAANNLPNQLPEEIKQERFDRLMQLQAQISAEKLERQIGKTLPVIIDEITDKNIIGRTQGDAPEVDGLVYIDQNSFSFPQKRESSAFSSRDRSRPIPIIYNTGDIIDVKITDSDVYDLFGEITNS